MIRFKAQHGDKTIIGLGITKANIDRLKLGEPIFVKGESIGCPDIEILIMYGEDLNELNHQLAPLCGEQTKIYVDPMLKEVPEDARTMKEGQKRTKGTI